MADADLNIIRMSDLPAFVADTLNNIRAGVGLANEAGIAFDMHDEKVTFDVVLVSEFQTLPIRGGETSESTETRKGKSVTVGESVDETSNGGTSTEEEGQRTDIHEERNAENIKTEDDDE